MVVLIGAASCTGKTVMAQRLLEIYKIPYLSIDHLKMGLYRADSHCGFTPKSSNEIIESKMWPIIKGIIMTIIENNQHIIIEGGYLLPHRLKEFTTPYLKHIIPVFMGLSGDYMKKNLTSGILMHRCDIESRRYEEERTIDQMITENERIKAACLQSAVNFFEICGDYEKETAQIYQWIDKEIEKHKKRSSNDAYLGQA